MAIAFPCLIMSCGVGEFVRPSVDDGVAIDVIDAGMMRSLSSCFEVTRTARI